jgi:translation initiation factor eIF-2B subunit beta
MVADAAVTKLVMKLKRRQLSSKDMAVETAKVLERVIGAAKGNNPRLLLTEVQDIGRRLEEAAGPGELVVGNICRRVLFIIRDEYSTLVHGGKAAQSEEKVVSSKQPSLGDVLEGDLALPGADRKWTDDVPQSFKSVVVESIKELIKEIESIKEHVADQAMEHVHANEVILTCGYSTTVLHFLMEVARRNRKFEVVVTEMAPTLEGHAMAQALAKAGISTTVITDAAIFALMARVNKVGWGRGWTKGGVGRGVCGGKIARRRGACLGWPTSLSGLQQGCTQRKSVLTVTDLPNR